MITGCWMTSAAVRSSSRKRPVTSCATDTFHSGGTALPFKTGTYLQRKSIFEKINNNAPPFLLLFLFFLFEYPTTPCQWFYIKISIHHELKSFYYIKIRLLLLIICRSAEMPTECAPVNYCGTQAPIWLRLDQQLPDAFRQVELTGCSSWSLMVDDSDKEEIAGQQYDCCSMAYPITVRNCSGYLIYRLQPTEACNMAYCAQLPSTAGNHNNNLHTNIYSIFGSSSWPKK